MSGLFNMCNSCFRLMIKNLQWNSATITWQRVSRPDSLFYRISYHSEENTKPVVVSVGSSRTQLQLKGLQQGMGYFVTLKTGNGTVFSTAEVKDFFLTPGMFCLSLTNRR